MWAYDLTKVNIPMRYVIDAHNETNEFYEFEIEFKMGDECYSDRYLAQSLGMKIYDILQLNEKIHLRNIVVV